MEIKGYAVKGEIRWGIHFHQKNRLHQQQLFFWAPAEHKHPEFFGKWTGWEWQTLPVDRIPQKRREMLQQFWGDRARIQGETQNV